MSSSLIRCGSSGASAPAPSGRSRWNISQQIAVFIPANVDAVARLLHGRVLLNATNLFFRIASKQPGIVGVNLGGHIHRVTVAGMDSNVAGPEATSRSTFPETFSVRSSGRWPR